MWIVDQYPTQDLELASRGQHVCFVHSVALLLISMFAEIGRVAAPHVNHANHVHLS